MAVEPSYGQGGAGFSQNGTIDWGQLASRTVSFSVDVLTRLSAANVDSYTLEVGRIISSQFSISKGGTDNVTKALRGLKSHRTLGDVLWFGFGFRHIVRAMPSTDEGLTCLALCNVISEFYPDDISAEIFHELVKTFNIPPQGTPSVLQWKTLIRACSGSLACSTFAKLVDDMIQLSPFQSYSMLSASGNTGENMGGWSTPQSIAEALRGIGSVSRGQIKALTVMGGNDAGWLAAVCTWLFDLLIVICDIHDNEIYSNCGGKDVQVKIVYERRGSSQSVSAQSTREESQRLLCIGKTYNLTDATDIIQRNFAYSHSFLSGRSPWETILKVTFGHSFEQVMKNHHLAFANAVGNAARLLQGIVLVEYDFSEQLKVRWRSRLSGSFGRGYIQNMMERFPELASLQAQAERAAQISLMDANASYQQDIDWLSASCNCFHCASRDSNAHPEGFCYRVLVETILSLGIFTSEMEIEDGLFPKRAGIMAHYQRQLASNPWRHDPDIRDEFGPFAYVLAQSLKHSTAGSLVVALQLFTGYTFTNNIEDYNVAGCANGICVYRYILADVSDDTDIAGKVCVMPGAIELHGKPYDRVSDSKMPGRPIDDLKLKSLHLYSQVAIDVTETSHGLSACFAISAKGLEVEPPKVLIAPSDLVDQLALARCRVHCAKVAAIPDTENASLDVLGTEVRVIRGDRLARCAAVALAAERCCRCILKVNECIQCCIKAGLADPNGWLDLENGLIVVSSDWD